MHSQPPVGGVDGGIPCQNVKEINALNVNPGGTSILGGQGERAWTSHQVWSQNLGQGLAKFIK